eukprot:15465130-Alexandrium_andersonii.AAC.1
MLPGRFLAVLRPAVAAIWPARRGDPADFRYYPASVWPLSGQLWPRAGRLAAVIRPLFDVILPVLGRSPASLGREQAGSPR